jgi:hypothetical protein
MRNLLLMVVALTLGACVKSDVSRFNNFTTPTMGATVFVMPTKQQQGSAEFSQHSRSILRRLVDRGFREVSELQAADYIVMISYGLSGSKQVAGSTPTYGQTGGGTTYHSGTATAMGSRGTTFGTYSGTSYTPATFGQTGSIPYNYTVHARYLNIRMIDRKKSNKDKVVAAYEGSVKSSGKGSSFAAVSECMMDALFKDFFKSGTERETLPTAQCGK